MIFRWHKLIETVATQPFLSICFCSTVRGLHWVDQLRTVTEEQKQTVHLHTSSRNALCPSFRCPHWLCNPSVKFAKKLRGAALTAAVLTLELRTMFSTICDIAFILQFHNFLSNVMASTLRHLLLHTESSPLACYWTRHKVQLRKAGNPPNMNVVFETRAQPAGLADFIAKLVIVTAFSIASASNGTPQWKSTGVSADCVTVVKSRYPPRRAGVGLPTHVTGSPQHEVHCGSIKFLSAVTKAGSDCC